MTSITSQPIASHERLINIDIIRGVAVLGILIMNIQAFSMVFSAYSNPLSFGDLSGANFYVYYFSHLFADQKFMTIFSLLFGTSIVLMAENISQKQGKPTKIHYKRMFILALVGMAHAYLLWFGDILFGYALGGMIAYTARNKSPRFLFIFGFILVSLCSLIMYGAGASLPYWEQADLDNMKAFWAPAQELIKADIAANQSSWVEQMDTRHVMAAKMQGNVVFYLIRVIGLMFIGMALYKIKFFSPQDNNKRLAISGLLMLIFGLAIIAIGNEANFAAEWSLESMFLGAQYNYWGSLAVAYSYIAFLLLFCRSTSLKGVKNVLANVGKMALTNYLLHSFICGFIFFGWGLGYYGTFERTEQIMVVMGVWIFQLWFSTFWMNRFKFGPFEWLWRISTYGKLQALKK